MKFNPVQNVDITNFKFEKIEDITAAWGWVLLPNSPSFEKLTKKTIVKCSICVNAIYILIINQLNRLKKKVASLLRTVNLVKFCKF